MDFFGRTQKCDYYGQVDIETGQYPDGVGIAVGKSGVSIYDGVLFEGGFYKN